MIHVSSIWCNCATFCLSKCEFHLAEREESGIATEDFHIQKEPKRWQSEFSEESVGEPQM